MGMTACSYKGPNWTHHRVVSATLIEPADHAVIDLHECAIPRLRDQQDPGDQNVIKFSHIEADFDPEDCLTVAPDRDVIRRRVAPKLDRGIFIKSPVEQRDRRAPNRRRVD